MIKPVEAEKAEIPGDVMSPEGEQAGPEVPDDGGSVESGCPGGGGVDGGICKPYTNVHRSTWMSTYTACRYLRINDSILPGTHDSGMDKEAVYQNSYETCQDVSPYKQLMTGIRVLDLRVQFYNGYGTGDPKRLMIFHSLNSGRTIQGDVLDEVLRFREHAAEEGNAKREVIILDFHEFKDFDDAAHRELAEIIKGRLGDIIIDPWMNALTINELWQFGDYGVVVAYNASARDSRFWDGLNQRWIGENFPSTDELKSFMDRVAAEQKPDGQLRSIQCAKYNSPPAGTPDDFSDKVREWFYSENRISYIQKFYVINTDWSLRQRLIDNCIHANRLRLENRGAYTDFILNQTDGEVPLPSGYRSMNVRVTPGHWARYIRLPDEGDNGATIVLKSVADQTSEIIIGNSGEAADRMPFEPGSTVAFRYASAARTWEMLHKKLGPLLPPPAPGNFRVDNENTHSIDMSWDPVPGAVRYSVWHQVPLSWSPSHVGDTAQTSYRESLGFLPPLDRGARWVKAIDENGRESKASNVAYYDRQFWFRFW